MAMNIDEELKKIIKDRLKIDEAKIKPEAGFTTDLGMDSLDSVELIMEIEAKFGISIPDTEAQKMTTVKAARDIVETLVAKKGAKAAPKA